MAHNAISTTNEDVLVIKTYAHLRCEVCGKTFHGSALSELQEAAISHILAYIGHWFSGNVVVRKP